MKLLVIRRDNIGDLVCTTPLVRSLRKHYPTARICALVNSYNAAALHDNSDVDAVYVYTKLKHRGAKSALAALSNRVKLYSMLRREHFDYVILATPLFVARSVRIARLIGAKQIIGYERAPSSGLIDKPLTPWAAPQHEVELVSRLLQPLGIDEAPPATSITADAAQQARVLAALRSFVPGLTVGIHISARKPSNRWPGERFSGLMRRLAEKLQCRFVLLWSPGDENNPLHPGDDGKAATIVEATRDLSVLAYRTEELAELIAALSLCDYIVCSDGGAMHLAAGLGKPIVCFFGKSDATRWRPWGVPYALLQKPSLDVADISVDEALDAVTNLIARGAAAQ